MKSFLLQIKESLQVPFRLSLLMFLLLLVQLSFSIDLGFLGVKPWSIPHLVGLITAPLVHGSLVHLLANVVPFMVLATSLYFFYDKIANQVLFYAYFLPYAIVWFVGRPYFHIGSSGTVYALAFFMISLGIFRGTIKSLLISGITIFLYGSLIYGVVPTERKISWETHLAGAAVGIVTAFYMSRKKNLG
ncbi:rhomboid family intramembrane serine protease [Mongoliitalea daihaiensis]|uniref:rhomboid family intramembrane serine protease n=1 Tax=Mongoliitalea daihaiensis TaxID=2782006 RepID=UPI001F27BF49|nr:rhomboid family intramembrane serine protease [Mongoliitalea daihaiensis]UJP64198.1 rhomboid family intramembrane serine protease [Mongoliitalea daihaiensis]